MFEGRGEGLAPPRVIPVLSPARPTSIQTTVHGYTAHNGMIIPPSPGGDRGRAETDRYRSLYLSASAAPSMGVGDSIGGPPRRSATLPGDQQRQNTTARAGQIFITLAGATMGAQ